VYRKYVSGLFPKFGCYNFLHTILEQAKHFCKSDVYILEWLYQCCSVVLPNNIWLGLFGYNVNRWTIGQIMIKDLKLHKLAKFRISGRNSKSELKDRNPIASKSLS
jgi:hypothetical protein